MPLITPKTDWIAGDGVGFSDMNRIEGNILYLQNENKTINGTNTFTGLITVSSSGITSSSTNINLLKPTEINAGVSNSVLKLISTDTFCFIDMSDDTTTQSIAIGRSGNVLQLNPFSGTTLVGQTTDNGTDLLQVGSDTDISVSFGKMKMGYNGLSNYVYLGLSTFFTSTDYSLRFDPSGTTLINAITGQSVIVRNNNTDVATFSGTQIDLLKPVNITAGQNEAMKFTGTSTGVSNQAYIGFYESNGTTRQAFVGLGSGASANLNLTAEAGDVNITSNDTILMNGKISPTDSPAEGSFSLTTTPTTVPRGVYMLEHVTGSTVYSKIEIEVSGTWYLMSNGGTGGTSGDLIFSDGVNVRISMESGTGTVFYRRF